MKKFILSFLVLNSCLLLHLQAAVFSGGSGTEADPYQIATLADLQTLSANVNSGILYIDSCFIQTADIDASSLSNFTPIGKRERSGIYPFYGTYDGQGHVIRNLTINNNTLYNVGVFGCLGYYGNIKNLDIENINVTGENTVGGLVGYLSGSITNCYCIGNIVGGSYVGGLVGYIHLGLITNSYSSGSVYGTGYSVGGLVGYIEDGYPDRLSIENCYSNSNVIGVDRVGGLVGYNSEGRIENCYSIGNVYGTGYNIGGLIGRNFSYKYTKNCYWNMQTSNQTIGVSWNSAGVTGYCTAQMKEKSNFNDWDFSSTWAIDGITNNGYPFLSWQPSVVPVNWKYILISFVLIVGTLFYRKIR